MKIGRDLTSERGRKKWGMKIYEVRPHFSIRQFFCKWKGGCGRIAGLYGSELSLYIVLLYFSYVGVFGITSTSIFY